MRESRFVKRLDRGQSRFADFSGLFLSYQVPDRPCECVWTPGKNSNNPVGRSGIQGLLRALT
jgi:hypothetical protein